MEWAEQLTERHTERTLFVAFNYGGRAEILRAAERYQGGGEQEFRKFLYLPDMEDPDLIIRTSGELRLSNFLLWQAAYSELYFTDKLWPDFDRAEFERGAGRLREAAAALRGSRPEWPTSARSAPRPATRPARPRRRRAGQLRPAAA